MADQTFSTSIAAAPDLAALEQLRVAALGKSGAITALLKSLGGDGRRRRARPKGPRSTRCAKRSRRRSPTRKAALETAELERRLATERLDLSLPATDRPQGQRPSRSAR